MADPTTYALTGLDVEIRPGMVLPVPDDAAAAEARDRLSFMDLGIGGPSITSLGMLAEAVVFIAGVQGSGYPRPLLSTRVILFTGSHGGGLVAGPTPDPRHGLPLQHLAVNAGAAIVTLEWQPASAAIEYEDAITPEQMEAAMRAGFTEAERAADEGIELLVLAAGGPGASTAAAAVVAATTGSEATSLIGRVATPAGLYDDNAWMTRCLAVRDALHRVRDRDGDPRTVLCALGGADIAAATGLLLGAAYRRTPVMIDGPVGAAAALLANDFSAQARRWVLLPDHGRHMAVRLAAEALDLHPWLDLCLDLGEGAAALAALPMLQTALTLSGAGEPVDPTPPTRFDSTGNQVFVGVARPVEPTDDQADAPAIEAAAVGAATVDTPTAEASTVDEPDKAADKAPAKAVKTPAKGTPARSVSAPKESPVKEPKPPAQRAGRSTAKDADQATTASNPVVGGKTAAGTFPSRPAPQQAKPLQVPKPAGTGTAPAAPPKAGPSADSSDSSKTAAAPKPIETAKPAEAPKPAEASKPAEAPKPAEANAPAKPAEPPKPAPARAGQSTSDRPSKDPALKDTGPKDTGPKDTGPKDTGPKDTGPKDTGPKDTASKDGPGKEAAATEPVAAAPAATADAAKPDAAKPDPATPDAAKPDAAKPDAAKPDAAKPDAAKPIEAKPDAQAPADAAGAAATEPDGKADPARTGDDVPVAVAEPDGRSASSRAEPGGRSASSRAEPDGRSASSRAEDANARPRKRT